MPELDSIACADCFEYISALPDSSVDLVLTDPPYGTTCAPWDKRVDEQRLFDELWRVAKPAAPIIMFAQNPLAAELIVQQKKHFRYEWIWEKTQPCGVLSANRHPLRCHELVLVFYRKLPTYNAIPLASQRKEPYKIKRKPTKHNVYGGGHKPSATNSKDGRRFPRDVVKYSRDRLSIPHGTPKPFALVSMLIQQYTNIGDTVLDPFMGTGTTAAAAKACDRHWLGCEQNERFYDFARRRVEDIQPPLGELSSDDLFL